MESPEELQRMHEDSWIRALLDSPFLLLGLSLLIVFLSYTGWGVFELMQVPLSPLK